MVGDGRAWAAGRCCQPLASLSPEKSKKKTQLQFGKVLVGHAIKCLVIAGLFNPLLKVLLNSSWILLTPSQAQSRSVEGKWMLSKRREPAAPGPLSYRAA